ncbi:type II toxin-antitoxin system Phd/YefM family antitoxin [Actimicrobium sp. CCI2.3]|uniref:type II toxin-antitoxin system Phd/YefM family antitoxin n=1 Tax=Actimicrobium sp. CCI2.3 TaxID=3048616 RepID=UPI002B240FD9|nr:type II toxin-antitoxin system Phd/YefM family antitoxin [Actimicrobium sp. CCI2.3]MEB0023797.1 type II toxin-antitoxin system Phd/YefM family antitoxin [Actimicrobium sp. CCI2.3]
MRFTEQIKPISYLKDNTVRVINEITNTREPMIITQNGEPTFIVQDIVSYQQNQELLALLRLVALGNDDIAKGRVQLAESVFSELGIDMAKAKPE